MIVDGTHRTADLRSTLHPLPIFCVADKGVGASQPSGKFSSGKTSIPTFDGISILVSTKSRGKIE